MTRMIRCTNRELKTHHLSNGTSFTSTLTRDELEAILRDIPDDVQSGTVKCKRPVINMKQQAMIGDLFNPQGG